MTDHDPGDAQPPTPLDRARSFALCMRGFGNELAMLFGGPLFLVGSMLTSATPGDVDLRLCLDRETCVLYWGEDWDGPSWNGTPGWFARKREELKQSRRLTRTFGRKARRIDFQFQCTLFSDLRAGERDCLIDDGRPRIRVDTVPNELFAAGRGDP